MITDRYVVNTKRRVLHEGCYLLAERVRRVRDW